MLSRQNRYHGYNSLSFVYRNGSTVRSKFIVLKYIRNPRRSDYRVAVIVSRKIHKSAVKRNRVRRRIYEIVRQLPEPEPYDIVLTVFSDEVIDLSDTELVNTVRGLFRKANLRRKTNTLPVDTPHGIVKSREEKR